MNLLFVDCCVRGKEKSRTYALCESFLEELKRREADLAVKTLSVYKEDMNFLSREQLALRDDLEEKKDLSHPMFEYAKEFASADYILIGAPYWDYSFPACLKTYIELTSVRDIAFTYVETGSKGLCRADRMMYISTAGGFVPGIHAGELYMKQICDFYGIEDFRTYCLEGIDIDGTDVEAKMREAHVAVRQAAGNFLSEGDR